MLSFKDNEFDVNFLSPKVELGQSGLILKQTKVGKGTSLVSIPFPKNQISSISLKILSCVNFFGGSFFLDCKVEVGLSGWNFKLSSYTISCKISLVGSKLSQDQSNGSLHTGSVASLWSPSK